MSRLQEVKKVTKEWLSENINILKQENISLEVLIDNENCQIFTIGIMIFR